MVEMKLRRVSPDEDGACSFDADGIGVNELEANSS